MKLESSVDLLERVRARNGNASWYRLAKIIPASENTVANWRHQRTSIDRKFVTRIAELLGEPAEYVLACVEAERDRDAEMTKIWKRIAERARSTASILLVGLALLTVAGKASAADVGVELVGNVKSPVYTLCAIRGRARAGIGADGGSTPERIRFLTRPSTKPRPLRASHEQEPRPPDRSPRFLIIREAR